MKFAISGVTQQGNLGGAAMLLAVRQELAASHPDAEFSLLSITPAADRAGPPVPGVTVVWAHWVALVLLFLPLSLVAAPFRRFALTRWGLRRIGYFRTLLDCDALVDLSGIAFVDGRGPALMAYNTACCLPAILLDRPVLKLAQSLGPFQERLNRLVARWVLGRCTLVIARGDTSGRHLAELTGQTAAVCADTAFCLEVPPALEAWAAAEIARVGINRAPIMISPSRVLDRDCQRHGIDLAKVCAQLAAALQEHKHAVVLFAHSRAVGIAKNDDLAVCARIQALMPVDRRPPVMLAHDPVHARALIGKAAIFVGSRYHALVSAYARAVPSLALSWNDKYVDLARLFDSVDHVVPTGRIDAEFLINRVLEMIRSRSALSAVLQAAQPAVRRSATNNFLLATQALARARS